MLRRYTSRKINDPEDTAYMQAALRNNPHVFFNFPDIWKEWFMTHTEMLNAHNEELSVQSMRKLIYQKIFLLLGKNREWGPEIIALVTLLINSGLNIGEIQNRMKELQREHQE